MVNLPPPIWALIYVLGMGALSAIYPWKSIADLTVLPLGIVLIGAGLGLSIWAVTLFRREGTELNPTSETNKKLVIAGPFRYTRNPMYLSLVLFTLGIAFCVGSLPMFAAPMLLFATASIAHIPFEEEKMRRQFGTAFDDYARRTRRWI
ncbi:MAG: isoprenylcysteine carboxylmethyltransferase family protein [Alphaproteobacteria bacterium]|nr:isoprenylcysteine carboxylmethyltransferase family protein [Alphaproteobacteria bacterium]